MFGRWWWALITGHVVEDWPQLLEDVVARGQITSIRERDPCAFTASQLWISLYWTISIYLDIFHTHLVPSRERPSGLLVQGFLFVRACRSSPLSGYVLH